MYRLTVNLPRLSVILLAVIGYGYAHAEILPDPTQPPGVVGNSKVEQYKKTQPRWMLTSILIAAERRTATINGKRIAVGDDINGATVLVIEPSQVILQPKKSKHTLTLQLLPRDFKRMAGNTSNDD